MRIGRDLEPMMRVCGPDNDAERAERAVRDTRDWAGVVGPVRAHGLGALLHRGLAGVTGVPDDAAAALAASARKTARQSFALGSVLIEVLDVLRSEGVDALPLKGATLAAAAYGDPGVRDYGDLDVLVAPSDAWAAIEALSRVGFEFPDALSRDRQEVYLRTDSQVSLRRAAVEVELHTALAQPQWGVYPTLPELATRASAVELYGRTVPALAPPDMVLAVSVHASKAGWGRLEWAASLAWLARRDDMDWDALADQAKDAGIARTAGVGFALAEEFLRDPLPAGARVLTDHDRAVRPLARDVRPNPGTPPGTMPVRERLGHQLWLLRIRERWRDRLYLVVALLRPTTHDVAVVDLRPSLRWLYYPLRLIRVVARAMRIPLRS